VPEEVVPPLYYTVLEEVPELPVHKSSRKRYYYLGAWQNHDGYAVWNDLKIHAR